MNVFDSRKFPFNSLNKMQQSTNIIQQAIEEMFRGRIDFQRRGNWWLSSRQELCRVDAFLICEDNLAVREGANNFNQLWKFQIGYFNDQNV